MRLRDYSKTSLISHLLKQGKEGECWDFKQEWHSDRNELIKDIICFANTVHDEDCYLIFGVADNLEITGMHQTRIQQADIIDTLSNLNFAGDNIPKIEIETVNYEKTELDVLTIFNTNRTPIYLKKTHGNMLAGCIYTRNGDKNTPDKGNAEIYEIENLWKKRLGLTKPPLEYIIDRLQNKLEWNQSGDFYYNIYKPQYCLKRYCEEDVSGGNKDEFYAYSQTNESVSYSMLNIMAYGTVLDSYQIAVLDSGRLCIPTPEWGFLNLEEQYHDMRAYKYYVEDSNLYRVLEFMYDSENEDERTAFVDLMRVVLLYRSEKEKDDFEGYISSNPELLYDLACESKEYDYIATENYAKTKSYKFRLRMGLVLNKLLVEQRERGI